MKIAIVIPVRNRCSITVACLTHLQSIGALNEARTFVVDDASTDNTPKSIAEHFPETNILYGDGNLWWGGAIRMGIEHVVAAGFDRIVLLNDDCRPSPDAWSAMVCRSRSDENIILLADVYSEHTPPVRLNLALEDKSAKLDEHGSELTPLNNSTGQFVIFSRHIVECAGLPPLANCRHYYDGVLFPHFHNCGFRIFRLNNATAHCDWEALRALEPYDRLLISDISLSRYLVFTLTHQKSRYRLGTRFSQMRTRHGPVKGVFLAAIRYLIFAVESLRAWSFRLVGHGDKRFLTRVKRVGNHDLQHAILSEYQRGTKPNFS